MKRKSFAAFTLIEMLVVISIIVVLAAFAGPAIFSALTKGQMTASVNNARQLFLAGQQMSLDGTTNSDASLGWPGDITSPAAVTGVVAYCDKLVQNNYITAGDLQKIMSAPGVNATVTGGTTSGSTYTPVTAISNPALKVYKLQEKNPSNTIFAVTNNYTYNTALTATGAPYGDKGFIVQRKGGDASIFKKGQATGSGTAFQSLVGRLPGDAEGTVGTESSSGAGQNVLTNP
jgi:prepilin-type N-terminal cleavage/methylation domain-containing protein